MKRHGKKWTENEKQYLREHYGSADKNKIIEDLQRTWGAITIKATQELNLSRSVDKKEWEDWEYDIIKNNYPLGDERLFQELLSHRSWDQIRLKASILGVKNTPCDIEFFRSWSKDLAYFLGFWFSNGCLATTKRDDSQYVMLTVPNNKVEILENIKQKIKYQNEIISHGETSKRITIVNQDIYNFLKEKGAKENKHRNIDIPKLPAKYDSHFLRGYTDGNGLIRTDGKTFIRLSYHSWMSFLRQLNKLIYKNIGHAGLERTIEKNKIIQEIIFRGDAARELLNWIYSDMDTDTLRYSENYEQFMDFKNGWH